MKKIITTLILCCCIVSLFACSCMFRPFGVESIIDSDQFIKGKVIEKSSIQIDEDGKDKEFIEKRGIGLYRYKIEVIDYIKGSGEKTMFVYSNMGGAACGVNYNEGMEMYIFTHKNGSRSHTSSCSGNFSAEYGDEEPTKSIIENYTKSTGSQKWKNVSDILVAEGEVINRAPNGVWNFYHEDGSLKSTGKFKNGLEKGKWTFYYPNGTLNSVGKLKKGKRKGKWKYYVSEERAKELTTKKGIDIKVKNGLVLNYITVYKKGKVVDTKYLLK